MATPLAKEQAKASSPSRTSKDPRLPPPGSWLTRSYKGHTIEVKVLSQGFQYQDSIFSSLMPWPAKSLVAIAMASGSSISAAMPKEANE